MIKIGIFLVLLVNCLLHPTLKGFPPATELENSTLKICARACQQTGIHSLAERDKGEEIPLPGISIGGRNYPQYGESHSAVLRYCPQETRIVIALPELLPEADRFPVKGEAHSLRSLIGTGSCVKEIHDVYLSCMHQPIIEALTRYVQTHRLDPENIEFLITANRSGGSLAMIHCLYLIREYLPTTSSFYKKNPFFNTNNNIKIVIFNNTINAFDASAKIYWEHSFPKRNILHIVNTDDCIPPSYTYNLVTYETKQRWKWWFPFWEEVRTGKTTTSDSCSLGTEKQISSSTSAII